MAREQYGEIIDYTAWDGIRAAEISARANRKIQNGPPSIIDKWTATPLSKFDNPSDHINRRRVLRQLNRELAATPKSDQETRKKIMEDMRGLEAMQFVSRVRSHEVLDAIGDRRLRI